MNQTRTFLLFAWLVVATLLFMAWGRDKAAPDAAAGATPTTGAASVPAATGSSVPSASAAGSVPQAQSSTATPVTPAMTAATPDAAMAPAVTVTTDVLRATLDGGAVREADLLGYPQTATPGAAPVRLFASDAAHFYQAQSGWVSTTNAAPNHEAGFVPVGEQRAYVLPAGAEHIEVPFQWTGPDGVTIRRTYTFTRNSYAVQVRDDVANAGTKPWQGFVYRQLERVPPVVQTGFTHPESYSFHGAAWFRSATGFDKRKFAKYEEGGALNNEGTGGWIAMLQHHFFAAWIPGSNEGNKFSLSSQHVGGTTHALATEASAIITVAPGARAETSARLWVGPKLVKQIQAQQVPGLERAVDFSSYAWLAWIAELMFAVLAFVHGLVGNWGWAIIGLVVIVKALMFPLSAAQYKSMAKMRRFQPRIEQLKERYGDDKQKLQMAMMELYKKEKINPVGGCLPLVVQMPIFLALYYTLLESVELRQAPWIGWIHNLTAPDPYFILPIINIAVTWATQKLSPATIADPMQRKMMQIMPVAMGVMFAFFPAGLVLYWVTNGSLGLLQQWWMTRKYGGPAKPATT
ncbi:MAG TPA: membrane protein insertase YidC [Luteimonas sp.]|nr:membrane protein insertase YidC [Luteimonas sp.]